MTSNNKITVLCVKEPGRLALDALISNGADISSIVTVSGDENNAIIDIAKSNNIECFIDKNVNDESFCEIIKCFGSNLCLSFSYPRILKKDFLNMFNKGCINFHPALLPNYRGCYPTVWPILNGDVKAFYTMHFMDEGIDTGNIIDKYMVLIDKSDTGYSLYCKLVKVIHKFLDVHISSLISGSLKGVSQNETNANYYGKVLPNDCLIDWNKSFSEIERFVRALYHPEFGGAYMKFKDKRIDILEVEKLDDSACLEEKPGTYNLMNGKVLFKCKDETVHIKKIKTHEDKVLDNEMLIYFKGLDL